MPELRFSLNAVAPERGSRPAVRLRPTMKFIRRAFLALSVAGAIAAALRVKGKGAVPPQQGGWRDITSAK